MRAGTDASQRYTTVAQAIVNFRDKVQGGVLSTFDELKTAVDPQSWLHCRTASSSPISG